MIVARGRRRKGEGANGASIYAARLPAAGILASWRSSLSNRTGNESGFWGPGFALQSEQLLRVAVDDALLVGCAHRQLVKKGVSRAQVFVSRWRLQSRRVGPFLDVSRRIGLTQLPEEGLAFWPGRKLSRLLADLPGPRIHSIPGGGVLVETSSLRHGTAPSSWCRQGARMVSGLSACETSSRPVVCWECPEDDDGCSWPMEPLFTIRGPRISFVSRGEELVGTRADLAPASIISLGAVWLACDRYQSRFCG